MNKSTSLITIRLPTVPSMERFAYLRPCLIVLACLSGCHDASRRYGVSGTVILKGEPLNQGVVTLVPVTPDSPTQGSAVIAAGKFSISSEQGLLPGRYRVSISSPDGKTPDADPNAAPGPSGNFTSKDRIPPEFNLRSTLEVEVKPDTKANSFEFKIP
jgi:hypothetical protein